MAPQPEARETRRTIGRLLREERIRQGREQREVAAELGIAAPVLSRLEHGHKDAQPLLRYLELSIALGVRFSDIVRSAEGISMAGNEVVSAMVEYESLTDAPATAGRCELNGGVKCFKYGPSDNSDDL